MSAENPAGGTERSSLDFRDAAEAAAREREQGLAATIGPIRRLDKEQEEQRFLDAAAIAALPEIIRTGFRPSWKEICEAVATESYEIADAMLAERRRKMEAKA